MTRNEAIYVWARELNAGDDRPVSMERARVEWELHLARTLLGMGYQLEEINAGSLLGVYGPFDPIAQPGVAA